MNAKFALALILTLHVSMSFCEEPPQELVEKYEAIRDKLYKRAEVFLGRTVEYFGANEHAQVVKGHLDNLPANPNVVAVRQVAEAIRKELEPLFASLRSAGLLMYNDNFRGDFRQPVEHAIERIGNFLDQVAPAE